MSELSDKDTLAVQDGGLSLGLISSKSKILSALNPGNRGIYGPKTDRSATEEAEEVEKEDDDVARSCKFDVFIESFLFVSHVSFAIPVECISGLQQE